MQFVRMALLRLPSFTHALTHAWPTGGREGWRWVGWCLLFGLLYGATARLGLATSSIAPNVTLVWAPTGLSLFVFLRWGSALWPGIVLGDLIANAGTGASLAAVAGISLGNLVQTFACWWALRRAGFAPAMERVRDVVGLMLLGTACAGLSALIGPTALWLDGRVPSDAWAAVALQWWMGDAAGVVVLTPFLLIWWRSAAATWSRAQAMEAVALLASLGLLCEVVFGGPLLHGLAATPGYYPASLALFPLAVWAALRFGQRGATLLTLLVTVAAVWGTVRGAGPFVDGGLTSSLVRWWVFANVITVTSLLLAASQSERDRARAQAIRDRDFGSAILDAEGALVVVLDGQGRIERVNRSFERATAFTSAALVGQRFEDALIPSEHHAKVSGHAELLRLKLADSEKLESPLRRRRGPPITVSWTATALRDEHGRMTHAIVSGIDVSARVEAADALRQARRQLEQRVVERTQALAEANAALQVQMAERQRLEHELIAVSEREQQRFGQALHDGLGQHLTATAIQAELLARDLESAGAHDAQVSAERVEAMLSSAIAQTRLLARGLYPVEMEEGGLMVALQQLADNTERQLRRPCTLDCPQPADVPDHIAAVHLYRIAQEAVNNAVKHAPASPVLMTLRQRAGALTLRVSNPLVAAPGAGEDHGIGLRIMRHRAQLIGADFHACARDGEWQVEVIWRSTHEP
jgi:PAS domain S-box-containing protein